MSRLPSASIALLLALPACHVGRAASSPPEAASAEAHAKPAGPSEPSEPETLEDSPEADQAAAGPNTEVIEIGVAESGPATTITATPERPAMPSMMSDIRMGPSG